MILIKKTSAVELKINLKIIDTKIAGHSIISVVQ